MSIESSLASFCSFRHDTESAFLPPCYPIISPPSNSFLFTTTTSYSHPHPTPLSPTLPTLLKLPTGIRLRANIKRHLRHTAQIVAALILRCRARRGAGPRAGRRRGAGRGSRGLARGDGGSFGTGGGWSLGRSSCGSLGGRGTLLALREHGLVLLRADQEGDLGFGAEVGAAGCVGGWASGGAAAFAGRGGEGGSRCWRGFGGGDEAGAGAGNVLWATSQGLRLGGSCS